MNSNELKRFLAKHGCTFDETRGKGSHITVWNGDKFTILPMHGQKELGTGLINKIKKDLGLK